MKYIFTALLVVLLMSGCVRRVDNPQTELTTTIHTSVNNKIGDMGAGVNLDTGTSAVGALTAVVTAASAVNDAKYVVTVNGNILPTGKSIVTNHGKLVFKYKGFTETIYVRDKNIVGVEYDTLLDKLLVGSLKEKNIFTP